jgi:hypothetical protein
MNNAMLSVCHGPITSIIATHRTVEFIKVLVFVPVSVCVCVCVSMSLSALRIRVTLRFFLRAHRIKRGGPFSNNSHL